MHQSHWSPATTSHLKRGSRWQCWCCTWYFCSVPLIQDGTSGTWYVERQIEMEWKNAPCRLELPSNIFGQSLRLKLDNPYVLKWKHPVHVRQNILSVLFLSVADVKPSIMSDKHRLHPIPFSYIHSLIFFSLYSLVYHTWPFKGIFTCLFFPPHSWRSIPALTPGLCLLSV